MRARIIAFALVATFVVIRAALHLSPNSDLNVGRFNVHHLFLGVLLTIVCGIPLVLNGCDSRATRVLAAGFGAGLALMVDEWVYLIVTDGSNASYLLPESFWGGTVLVVAAVAYVGWVARRTRRG